MARTAGTVSPNIMCSGICRTSKTHDMHTPAFPQQASRPSSLRISALRENGRASSATENEARALPSLEHSQGLAFTSETLPCFCGPFGLLDAVSQASFSSCGVSYGLCGQRTLNLTLPSGNISLRFYNLHGLASIA